MLKSDSNMGRWNISFGTESVNSNTDWDSLRKINEEAPDLFPIPPTRTVRYRDKCIIILCYTSDYRNEGNVKKSAEFIRKRVIFPFIINYFSVDGSLLYLHTPEGEFYGKVKHGLIPVDFGIRRNQSCSFTANPSYAPDGSYTMEKGNLPSQVLDTEYIYMPSTQEGIEAIKRKSCGKWMVFSGENTVQHDEFWSALLSLYRDGTLVGLKASAGMISGAPDEYIKGEYSHRDTVINCYTSDSENRDEVKEAATAIHKVIPYQYIMYYKTNGDSMDGKYYYEGCDKVTKYMWTVEGRFYERDELKRWKLSPL